MNRDPQSATETVEALEDIARDHIEDGVCINDVLDEFGQRSFGPFLLVPALIEISPVGGIPGLPTLLALFIATVAVQLLLGKEHVWLPAFVQRHRVRSGRLMNSAKKLESLAEWLDARFRQRWRRFTGRTMQKFAAIMVVLLCLTVPPLEFVPFASTAPMAAIAAFGLAIMVRDGLLLLGAATLSVAALATAAYLVATSEIAAAVF